MHRLTRFLATCTALAAVATTALATDPNPAGPKTRVNRLVSDVPSGDIEFDSPIIFKNSADLIALATSLSVAGGTAGVISINGHTGAVTVPTLLPTTVTAASYGDATHVPSFTVDAYGRLTSAANVALSGPLLNAANVFSHSGNKFSSGLEVDTSSTGPLQFFLNGNGDANFANSGIVNISNASQFNDAAATSNIAGTTVNIINSGALTFFGQTGISFDAATPVAIGGTLTATGAAGFTLNLATATLTGTLPIANGGSRLSYGRVATSWTSASASYSDVTGLAFTMAAGDHWTAHARILAQGTSGEGIRFRVTGPAVSSVLFTIGGQGGSASIFNSENQASFSATPSTSFVKGGGSAITGVIYLDLTVIGDGVHSGTVQVQANNQGGSGTATIFANSDLESFKTN